MEHVCGVVKIQNEGMVLTKLTKPVLTRKSMVWIQFIRIHSINDAIFSCILLRSNQFSVKRLIFFLFWEFFCAMLWSSLYSYTLLWSFIAWCLSWLLHQKHFMYIPVWWRKIMLYNCGMIFFILSLFIIYILSFGLVRLRTIRLCARAGTHIERRCSRSRAEDVTLPDLIIKNPERKWDWGANDIMTGSDGLGFLVILKKSSWSWSRLVDFWAWARPVQLGLRDAPCVCWIRWNS